VTAEVEEACVGADRLIGLKLENLSEVSSDSFQNLSTSAVILDFGGSRVTGGLL
jgi:hypothetical protein